MRVRYFFLAIIFVSVGIPLLTMAEPIKIDNPLGVTTVAELVGKIADFIFTLALWIAPIMFLLGGGYFLISAGDPQKIEMGKKIMTYAVIGLIIAISAKGLIALFKSTFGVQDVANPSQSTQPGGGGNPAPIDTNPNGSGL